VAQSAARARLGLSQCDRDKRKTLIVKFREQTDKVRDDFRETRDKVEDKIRLRAAIAHREIAFRTQKVRNDRAVKPALAMLKKFGEPRKRIG
jgi:hypothetical protein